VNKLLPMLLCSILLSGELEVDGNLKVTGNIDASGQPINNVGVPLSMTDAINGNVLQDVLRDDGVYEYKIRFVQAWDDGSSMTFQYFKNEDNYSTQYNGGTSFNTDMLTLLSDGYMIFQVATTSHANDGRPQSIWIYRRLVSDD